MTTLLICGSREASEAMLDYTRNAVRRAIQNGWQIIVGDAQGVDYCVVKQCEYLVYPVEVYGVTDRSRLSLNGIYSIYHRVETGDENWKLKYLTRDRHMVDIADCCLAIWNGTSGGTIYTYRYAQKTGKQAWLRTFGV